MVNLVERLPSGGFTGGGTGAGVADSAMNRCMPASPFEPAPISGAGPASLAVLLRPAGAAADEAIGNLGCGALPEFDPRFTLPGLGDKLGASGTEAPSSRRRWIGADGTTGIFG